MQQRDAVVALDIGLGEGDRRPRQAALEDDVGQAVDRVGGLVAVVGQAARVGGPQRAIGVGRRVVEDLLDRRRRVRRQQRGREVVDRRQPLRLHAAVERRLHQAVAVAVAAAVAAGHRQRARHRDRCEVLRVLDHPEVPPFAVAQRRLGHRIGVDRVGFVDQRRSAKHAQDRRVQVVGGVGVVVVLDHRDGVVAVVGDDQLRALLHQLGRQHARDGGASRTAGVAVAVREAEPLVAARLADAGVHVVDRELNHVGDRDQPAGLAGEIEDHAHGDRVRGPG